MKHQAFKRPDTVWEKTTLKTLIDDTSIQNHSLYEILTLIYTLSWTVYKKKVFDLYLNIACMTYTCVHIEREQ